MKGLVLFVCCNFCRPMQEPGGIIIVQSGFIRSIMPVIVFLFADTGIVPARVIQVGNSCII